MPDPLALARHHFDLAVRLLQEVAGANDARNAIEQARIALDRVDPTRPVVSYHGVLKDWTEPVVRRQGKFRDLLDGTQQALERRDSDLLPGSTLSYGGWKRYHGLSDGTEC